MTSTITKGFSGWLHGFGGGVCCGLITSTITYGLVVQGLGGARATENSSTPDKITIESLESVDVIVTAAVGFEEIANENGWENQSFDVK